MAQKIITIILGLIVIAGLAWYISVNYIQPRESLSKISNDASTSPISDKAQTNPILLYLAGSHVKEIWQVSLRNEVKKIFTDADEDFKIAKLSNLDANHDIVVLTSKNSLYKIDLLSGQSKLVRNNFPSVDFIILSPDSKQILYSRFSNLEENYGYSLYLEELDGSNKKVIVNSETEIKSPCFDSLGKQLAYSTHEGITSFLKVTTIKSKTENIITEFPNKNIDTLNFKDDNNIIFNLRENGNESAGIINNIDITDKKVTKLSDYDGGIANYLSPKNNYITWIIAQYKSKVDDKTIGQIYAQKNLEDKIPLRKGIQIIGWW